MAAVPNGAPENTFVLSNSGYVNISNSGSYSVSLTVSGSLDTGDTLQIDAKDSSNTTLSQSFTSASGGETSQVLTLNFGTSGLLQGPIAFDAFVYTGGVSTNVVATLGSTQSGVLDTIAPVVNSTGSVTVLNSTSVDFSGISITDVNFSGASLSYSGVLNSNLTGTVLLSGSSSALSATLSGLDQNATYSYTITATDLAGNTVTVPAGSFVTPANPTVVLSSSAPSTISGAISVTATFSTGVTGFTIGDISVTNGTVSGLVSTSSTGYTFTVTPSNPIGTLTVLVGIGTFTDSLGNMNTVSSNTLSYTINTPDLAPPDLTVSSHVENQVITGSTVTITGTVTDTGGVVSVTVNGFSAMLGTGTWSRTLTGLTAGTNTFTVIATDTSGNTGSTILHLIRVSVPSNVNTTLSGTTEAIVTFDTDITATGVVLYGTSSGSLTTTVTGAISNTNHTINLSGLTPNTTYYFMVHGVSGGQVGDSSVILSFKTPVVVDINTSSGAITAIGSIYLSGSTSTGATFSNSGSIQILSASDNGSMISFSLSGLVIHAVGSWDGVIQAPEIVNQIATGADSGYVFIGHVYQIGNAGSELGFSGQTVTVTIHIGASLSGQTLRIYRSIDGGVTYPFFTTCTVNSSGDCIFVTNQLSLFAFAALIDTIPDTFVFTDVSNTELSTVYQSNIVTITGINSPATVSIVGGQYSINGGTYTSFTGTVNSGDTIRVQLTSSASFSASTSSVLTIGGISDTFTVSTKASSSGGGGGSTGPGGPGAPFPPSQQYDNCPNGDYSASYYDRLCSMPPVLGGATWSITKSGNDFTITITTASGTSITLFHIPAVMLASQDIRFRDISISWAREYIRKLVARGIIDNVLKYRPNDGLTRAEFLKIAINTAGWSSETGAAVPFRDVESIKWYAHYVSIALSKGMINNGSQFFRPNAPITRAEAMKVLIVALGAKVDGVRQITFSDLNSTSNLTKYIETAKLLGIISGQTINGNLYFRPNDPITRAEIAKVVANSFGL